MLLNASSLQVHCTAFSVNGFKVSSMLFFLHDQHLQDVCGVTHSLAKELFTTGKKSLH